MIVVPVLDIAGIAALQNCMYFTRTRLYVTCIADTVVHRSVIAYIGLHHTSRIRLHAACTETEARPKVPLLSNSVPKPKSKPKLRDRPNFGFNFGFGTEFDSKGIFGLASAVDTRL